MNHDKRRRVALLYPGDAAARLAATAENSRFAKVFHALTTAGMDAEPAVYHDDFRDAVRHQLMQVDGVLVWVNPIEGGRDRSLLDALLRDVAATGIFVSAHPDIILQLGTKAVLYQTRGLGWGCDTHMYQDLAQMRDELPARLRDGAARVLKQYRGQSGDGVWKVEHAAEMNRDANAGDASMSADSLRVRARHARRGCIEETMTLAQFLQRCEPYFAGNGKMVDQAYQTRLPEGMIRCYLVHDTVAGFGHQAINALYPAPPGAPPESAPQPGPRLYHPPTLAAFQPLKRQLEQQWVPALQRLLNIDTAQLPVLWDCDFLLGPKDAIGGDTYVLCEINVSSVSPFPDDALPLIAAATQARVRETRPR